MKLTKQERSAVSKGLEVITRLCDSVEESIALKAAQTILGYEVDCAKFELDTDKYEKPAAQRIDVDVKVPNTIEIKLV